MNHKKGISILLIFMATILLYAQEQVHTFFDQGQQINSNSLIVLGSWAVANLATGAYGWSHNAGTNKYFHQMNFFWNTINLSLAGIEWYSIHNTDISMLNNQDMIEEHNRMESLYLINAGLDVIYMGVGGWIFYRSQQM